MQRAQDAFQAMHGESVLDITRMHIPYRECIKMLFRVVLQCIAHMHAAMHGCSRHRMLYRLCFASTFGHHTYVDGSVPYAYVVYLRCSIHKMLSRVGFARAFRHHTYALTGAEDQVSVSQQAERSKMERDYQAQMTSLSDELNRVRQELTSRTEVMGQEMERWRQTAEATSR